MSTMDRTSIWAWRESAWSSDRGNLDGFSVEAVDGLPAPDANCHAQRADGYAGQQEQYDV